VTTHRQISSGGPWEARIGYSRAIVAENTCYISGTTDAGPDGRSRHPGDAGRQARAVWQIIRRALEEGGFTVEDVVRTRTYVTRVEDMAEVAAVHGELFAQTRPAATMIQVAGLIDPTLLVEIEAEAVRGR
jgi:enamine deaminase RidA (YjgF/YER057c/UK114 family)